MRTAREILHDFIMLESMQNGLKDFDTFGAYQSGWAYCDEILGTIDKDSYWAYKSGLFIREDLWSLLESESSKRFPGDLKRQNWFGIGIHTRLMRQLRTEQQ